ncbi:MAG TPA: tetratricopeptide repeat protein, partial [Terriglobales bacterium]|nr:tetratricopeptide repeat protein [Terriglobales bacterium]
MIASRFLLFLLLSLGAYAADANPEDLLRMGRADEARRLLDSDLQRNPNNAQAYHFLCRLYYQLEQWDNALKMAEKAVALEPQNSVYHQWLGRAAGRKAENSNPFTAFGLARRVRAEFEKAVGLDGANISARADLAEYYWEAPSFLGGDKTKARQQAEAIAPRDPALAAYVRAHLEEKQGGNRAEQEYKRAISESGNQARYWTELAYYYRRAGRPQDMDAAIRQSLVATHSSGLADYDGAFLLMRTDRNSTA